MATARIVVADARVALRAWPAGSVHCCVTSPPYYGLRDYGIAPTTWGGDGQCAHEWGDASRGKFCLRCSAWLGQLGLEPTVAFYVQHLVSVLEEVRRVLRPDGTLWLNLGDSYSHGGCGARDADRWPKQRAGTTTRRGTRRRTAGGLKAKDLVGAPWRVAFALQDAGWWLRSDVVWSKPAPMPESVEDRPTKAHEYVFLLAKSESYFYDRHAVSEPATHAGRVLDYTGEQKNNSGDPARQRTLPRGREIVVAETRNLRDVWQIGPEPSPEPHFAVMPTALARTCVLAGTSERGACPACGIPWRRVVEKSGETTTTRAMANGHTDTAFAYGGAPQNIAHRGAHAAPPVGEQTVRWDPGCACGGDPVPCVVLDPFAGAGTTGLVALRLRRDFIGVEANPEYAEMARRRIALDAPLLDRVEVG